jgi:hypothetical protein
MFRAVRQWWQSGRGKETSRLFVFELTVVMIGVLAAQQVSNWASNRNQMQEVEGLHRDLVESFAIYRNFANTYDAAIPCYRQRVQQIMAAAASAKPVDPPLLSFAPILLMGPDEISPEDYRLLRARYGSKERGWIGSVEFNLQSTETAGRALEGQWYEFERLNPKNGPVSAEDRSAAREAAVKIQGYLATLQKNADFIQDLTRLLGIRVSPHAKLHPVTSCEEMWRTGRGYTGQG